MAELSIGELAARFGLATHVLRHWEDAGLLTPRRDAGGRRRYRADDVERVGVILIVKSVGFSLDEIRELFARVADRSGRRRLLQAQHARLTEHIARAEAARAAIEHALDCTAEDVRTCPHFRTALTAALPADPGQK
ncbi:MerR family transcriptional regulator [Nocardia farcinica]|uniref:MerR family transcriptional regulator n=1 Tax=Nocardia farcinica TaxID=37329 RepID=UPI0037B7E46D